MPLGDGCSRLLVIDAVVGREYHRTVGGRGGVGRGEAGMLVDNLPGIAGEQRLGVRPRQ